MLKDADYYNFLCWLVVGFQTIVNNDKILMTYIKTVQSISPHATVIRVYAKLQTTGFLVVTNE